MSRRAPRVLLTNDDGPPCPKSAPFVYPFAQALRAQLGWDVRVVVPSSQKSWVGKSYLITQTTTGSYYTPAGKDGTEGVKRELPASGGEAGAEWILIDGTPATCSNLGLHSLFPPGYFDLVIAGPNFGRNTSSAFALSSGTIGAAMAASLSGVPAIALSFGLMTGYKPPGEDLVAAGVRESCKVVEQLWNVGWGSDEHGTKVDVYSINVPLQPEILAAGGATVEWTTMSKTQYARLFKSIAAAPAPPTVDAAGPSAIPENIDEKVVLAGEATETNGLGVVEEHNRRPLKFIFAPDITSLINPTTASLEKGSDTHALHLGHISVTPIRAAFEPAGHVEYKWKL